jgi:hypothetical protein
MVAWWFDSTTGNWSLNHDRQRAMDKQTRPLYEIAREIRKTWPKVWFGAVPYLDAMGTLDKISDNYGSDSGKSIVLYFLSNATTWKGDDARRIKAELKATMKLA